MSKTKLQQIREHHEKFRKHVEEVGNKLRDQQMPVLTEEMFSLYEKTGNRLIYEDDYFERRRFLVVFGLLSAWHQKHEDIKKLEMVIREICQEVTWALPAHVNRQEKGWERTVDLFASETGQTLANILALNKEVLSNEIYTETKELITYRLLDSYMEVPRGEWRWEKMYNNWVSVCASCIGSAALFLLNDDKEKQQAIIERVVDTLPDYLVGMCDDGTCPEGMSYFTYGMLFYTGFSRQLKEFTNGEIDLLNSEKVKNIARFQHKCYFPGGNTVSFSDGERRDRFRLGLTCYLSSIIDGVSIPDISSAMNFDTDHCYRFMGNLQDDVWVQEYLEQAQETESELEKPWFNFLPDAQWAIWNKKRLGIAFKGGNNDEPHNHNDVGSFLLTADGEVFLTDLGCGEYTRQYFDPNTRYDILCNRSMGHSVPIVNGEEQKVGKEFGCEYFRTPEAGRVELSYSAAYEIGASWKLQRCLESYQNEEVLCITDVVEGEQIQTFEENFVTQIQPFIHDNQLILKGKKGQVIVEMSGDFGEIRVIKEVFQNHHGQPEDVWLIRIPIEVKACVGTWSCQCSYIAN